jgi:hypothetical protein
MTNKTTLDGVSKRVQSLKDRHERLEKDVRQLKDTLNIHDNWNAEIKELIGHSVKLRTSDGEEATGTLKWSDRYNLCILIFDKPRIYNKGGITWVEPA